VFYRAHPIDRRNDFFERPSNGDHDSFACARPRFVDCFQSRDNTIERTRKLVNAIDPHLGMAASQQDPAAFSSSFAGFFWRPLMRLPVPVREAPSFTRKNAPLYLLHRGKSAT
jgi:hypothetical protein